jgi:hypothetical protein
MAAITRSLVKSFFRIDLSSTGRDCDQEVQEAILAILWHGGDQMRQIALVVHPGSNAARTEVWL